MKLHHTEYKKNYKNYILECLKTEDAFINRSPTDEELIGYLFDRVDSECGYNVAKVGKQKAIASWLSGLALNIPFYYQEIVALAVEMGSIEPNPSDRMYNLVCDNYWDFMSIIILTFEPTKKT